MPVQARSLPLLISALLLTCGAAAAAAAPRHGVPLSAMFSRSGDAPRVPTPAPSAGVTPVFVDAVAISGHGVITGFIWNGGNPSRPYLWKHGELIDLDPQAAFGWSYPGGLGLDVNDRGQVVGSARVGQSFAHPLLLDHGQVVDMIGPRADLAIASAINDRGQVVGVWSDATHPENAFLWEDGRWTDLGPCEADPERQFPPLAYGLTLNERGDVIGYDNGGGSFLWKDGKRTHLDFYAYAINHRGQIVGSNVLFGNAVSVLARAYLWENGKQTDLGTLGSGAMAVAINDKGQIAGVSGDPSGVLHAVRWEKGRLTDLGHPQDGSVITVEGISAKGDVVGYDQTFGWLWKDKAPAPIKIGSIGSYNGAHLEIDDRGDVAFNEAYLGTFNAYLWSHGKITPIGVPPTPVARLPHGRSIADAAAMPAPPTAAAHASLSLAGSNPAPGPVTLRYVIPTSGPVRLEVFDVRGARVRSLVEGWQAAGARVVTWDGRDAAGRTLPRGVYLARLRTGSQVLTAKLVRSP